MIRRLGCGSCTFFTGYTPGDGECRRHAPIVGEPRNSYGPNAPDARWPRVNYTYSCGDFEAKEVTHDPI